MDTYLEFAGNHPLLTGGLVFTLFLLVFTELRRKAMGVTSVEPQAAVQLINKDAVVIDLRSAEAFAKGHIVNARNIPIDELPTSDDRLTPPTMTTRVICLRGCPWPWDEPVHELGTRRGRRRRVAWSS